MRKTARNFFTCVFFNQRSITAAGTGDYREARPSVSSCLFLNGKSLAVFHLFVIQKPISAGLYPSRTIEITPEYMSVFSF